MPTRTIEHDYYRGDYRLVLFEPCSTGVNVVTGIAISVKKSVAGMVIGCSV